MAARGACEDWFSSLSVSPLSLQKEKKGIVMVNFYNDYVTCSQKANISDVAGKEPRCEGTAAVKAGWSLTFISRSFFHADHFDHIKKVGGAEIIGFGGDYDGVPR